MSGGRDPKAEHYAFGPFHLDLPPGWNGAFEDGVHTLSSEQHELAIQISGFERDTSVEMSDLYAMVPPGMEDLSRFTLPSGLDGFGWVDPEDQTRRMVVRSGAVILAITEVPGDTVGEDDSEIAEEVIATLRISKGPI